MENLLRRYFLDKTYFLRDGWCGGRHERRQEKLTALLAAPPKEKRLKRAQLFIGGQCLGLIENLIRNQHLFL